MEKIIFKDYLKTKIIQNKLLLALMNIFFKLKNGCKFYKEVKKRCEADIFDYKVIARPLPYYPIEAVVENNYYGLGYTLLKYADLIGDTNAYIEHGIFFGPNIIPWQQEWKVKRMIVPSNVRLKHLRTKGVQTEIIVVGPYIHYAEPLLSTQKFNFVKSYLGKTLLVFPTHSIANVTAEYDIDHFITFIESIRTDYDSVLVSLYWLDAINPQIVKKYTDHSFKIVTAGNRFDPYFLNRQKSIISLADDTMSNDVGTHVGYCIYLNKSHYIFDQKVSYAAKNAIEEIRLKKTYNNKGADTLTYESEIGEVKIAFSKFTPGKISDLQKQVVDKYWGMSEIKSKSILKELLN